MRNIRLRPESARQERYADSHWTAQRDVTPTEHIQNSTRVKYEDCYCTATSTPRKPFSVRSSRNVTG